MADELNPEPSDPEAAAEAGGARPAADESGRPATPGGAHDAPVAAATLEGDVPVATASTEEYAPVAAAASVQGATAAATSEGFGTTSEVVGITSEVGLNALAEADEEHEEDSPYKFLDYYTAADQDIFFGRKRETKILLSDVIVNRLVVLFAKTGTGKTSLINAGVRPRLEERGYATFFIRVKEDPVESARACIKAARRGLDWRGATFAEQLNNLARELQRPVALFFDQFEEFFIYAPKDDPQKRREYINDFVANVAALYHSPDARIHLVFSMREEWFVWMDEFRSEIPNIFHNESNLRLRWFDEAQAREAIKLPAEVFGVTVEDELVDKLIEDLAVGGEVEPAQLQIVCYTLWRETEGDRITLEHYKRLGRPGSRESIATQVLYRRLEEEFEKIETEEQLQLLYALLPKLRTPWRTKWVRDIVGLRNELVNDFTQALSAGDPALREIIDDEALRGLTERLKAEGREDPLSALIERLEASRFVRRSVRDDLEVIELVHDYLVESLDRLQERVKAVWPRHLLARAAARDGDTPVPREEFEKISRHVGLLNVGREQAKSLFASALAYGLHMRQWFDLASAADAWPLLESKIGDIEETSNVIDLLAELHTPEAFSLLRKSLPCEEIASYAVDVLSRRESLPVVEFMKEAAAHEHLRAQALAALERLGRSRRNTDVAEAARQALRELSTDVAERSRAGEERASRAGDNEQRRNRLRPLELMTPPHSEGSEDQTSESLPPSQSVLEPHYRFMVKAFAEGRVVPFLGAGVGSLNLGENYAGVHAGRWPPDGRELALHLASEFDLPPAVQENVWDLSRVAQYISVLVGRSALREELHRLFAVEEPPTELHQLLAELPATQRKAGAPQRLQPLRGLLILTTNYDDLLERAFAEAAEPFHLVTYIAEGEQRGQFLHTPPGDEGPRVIERPNEYDGFSDGRAVILKLSGGIDREGAGRDSFVITEDDYIEQLARADFSYSVPITLAAKLRRSHFLFLGCSLSEWGVRVALRRILGEQRHAYKSWAVRPHPDRVEQELWLSRGVDVLDVPLEDYTSALHEHLRSLTSEVS